MMIIILEQAPLALSRGWAMHRLGQLSEVGIPDLDFLNALTPDRWGGRSRKMAVALTGVHTLSKNPRPFC